MININRINQYGPPLWEEIDQFFNQAFSRANQRNPKNQFRVSESGTQWTLQTDLPGFSKSEVQITVEDNLLKIVAEATDENPGFASGFTQHIRLSDLVDRSKVTARLENGVLEIVLPRREEKQKQEIRIDVN